MKLRIENHLNGRKKETIIFNRFLKEKHCYNQYYNNLNKEISEFRIHKFLSEAFNWQFSPEGDTFWRTLHLEWLTIIKSWYVY